MSFKKKLLASLLILLSLLSIFIISFPNSGSLELNREVEIPFDIEDEALIYFGYVGCSQICTPALEELKLIDNIKLYFIDLNSNPIELIDSFVKYFNPNFIGVSLKSNDLNKMVRDFSVVISQLPNKSGDISHSGFLYFIKKDKNRYFIKNILFTKPFNKNDLDNIIKKFKKES